ncbi:MAG: ferrous iron transport protein B [Lachnospiraceae bacterium]
MNKPITVAFVGNPNCGKTTLFNAYTGAKLKVANWPGVTVEKKEGAMKYHNHSFKLVDLPGIYSLTSYTMEETLSRQYILEDEVDVIVNIVDASCLERNLYLTLQLIELGKPVVMALNMMDIVEERGMEIDLHRLPEMLGIPVVPVSARKRKGLDILMHTIAHHKEKTEKVMLEHHHYHMEKSRHSHDHHLDHVMVYSDAIEDQIDLLSERLLASYPDIPNVRWHAIKYLDFDAEILKQYPIDVDDILSQSLETQIINEKYDFIDEVMEETVVGKSRKMAKTDQIDHWMTHPVLGVPIFLCIMALVFFLTFTIGDWLKGYFEIAVEAFGAWVLQGLQQYHVADWLISLVVDGIIGGVGGILTFLPNIFILFLALAILEDSGYMARVAYVMDGIMGKLGLSGRAFIPMLLGFGCSVPAIMASRALEDMKDRKRTILVIPFMSCSARLPIYVVFSQMFFQEYAMVAAYSMYVLGVLVAILVSLAVKGFSKGTHVRNLIMELPEYKKPNARTIAIYVWEKIKDYLSKAGTVIFIASIILWFVLNLGPHGMATEMQDSFGAIIGKWLVPLLKPAGLGYWQVAVALIAGIAAKEVVVSSMSVLYGIANISSAAGMATMSALLGENGFGALNAYALMVFCLLYIPCTATIATMKRETNSWKWTVGALILQLGVAWAMATLVYQIGSLLIY